DTGFLTQFKRLKHTDSYEYKPVSKFPQCIKDISFWLPENNELFDENDLNDIVHSIAGGIIEQVELIDDYTNKKGRRSHCYRIVYRSNERTLTNAEINELHEKIGLQLVMHFNVELR
ncbi:phenylalanine--tRNA ligase-like protein, partial [Leptotrombidium deliense]